MKPVREKRFFVILFIGLMSLLTLQLLSDFIEAIYADFLITESLNHSLVALVFLLTPLILVLFGQRLPPLLLLLFGEMIVIFRILEVSAGPAYKILFAGCGVGSFFVFLPGYLHFIKDSNRNTKGASFGLGFALAVFLWIAFKTVNASVDITAYGAHIWTGWVVNGLTFLLLPMVILGGDYAAKSRNRQIFGKKSERPSVFMPAWGLISVITLVLFVFGSPSVVARWTEGDYIMIIAFQVAFMLLFVFQNLLNLNPESTLIKPILVAWNGLFVAIMVILVFRLQLSFPDTPSSYPFLAPESHTSNHVLLYLLIILSPVLFVNVAVFASQVIKTSVSVGRVGLGFFSASLILLLLVIAHILTSLYDFVPVIGPFFRDKFWFVHLLAGLGMFVPVLLSRHELTRDRAIRFTRRDRFLLGVLFCSVAGVIVFGIPKPEPSAWKTEDLSELKVMTYNVQQGYDPGGAKNYNGQLQLIREADPDILGLQESDSVRIAGGNADIVRYFAQELNMFMYYGPSPVNGTFGIALLSKWPLINPYTLYLHSKGEQSAAIGARVKVGSSDFNILVTHLGRKGETGQQKAILNHLQDKSSVILMGGFNFVPGSAQYQTTIEQFIDTWSNIRAEENPAFAPPAPYDDYQRTDHIFTSNDLTSLESRYLFRAESDHPALLTKISVP